MKNDRFRLYYYPASDMWIIEDTKTNRKLSYHLNQVEIDTIIYCAKLYGILDSNLTWEMLDEETREKLLDWFEYKVFPSEEFGYLILADIEEELKEV